MMTMTQSRGEPMNTDELDNAVNEDGVIKEQIDWIDDNVEV